jgi:hypothetical protein
LEVKNHLIKRVQDLKEINGIKVNPQIALPRKPKHNSSFNNRRSSKQHNFHRHKFSKNRHSQ